MPVKYLYILSQRYSGSTLLSFLLATHPEIATIGERRKFFVKSIRPEGNTGLQCSCGETFQDCAFWNSVKERVLSRVDPQALETNATEFQFFNNRYLDGMAQDLYLRAQLGRWPFRDRLFSRRIALLEQFNRELVRAILDKEKKAAFLDSSKNIQQAFHLSRIRDFDLHIIWLSRDPRAQVASALKYNHWTVAEATRRWKQEMEENQNILDRLGAPYTRLTYEALCRDPEGEMKKLLLFAGLSPEDFSLDFREYEQHIMGNYNMRLGKDTRIRERRDWLEKLKPEDITLIESMTENYRSYYTDV